MHFVMSENLFIFVDIMFLESMTVTGNIIQLYTDIKTAGRVTKFVH